MRDGHPAGRCLLTNLSFGQLAKDFNGKANIVKLWVAGFPPMERRQAAYKELQKQYPNIKELESIGAVSSDVQGDTANKVGAILAKYPKGKIDAIWGTWDAFSRGRIKPSRRMAALKSSSTASTSPTRFTADARAEARGQ